MPLVPGTKLGPFEIAARLGAGGMGEVYRARDTRLGRDVAIKVLPEAFAADPDRLRRFEQEARSIAALNHPNICHLHDVGPGYLVLEYVPGDALRGPATVDEALRIARQIASALDAAHERGILHRDLKPDNIIVTRASGESTAKLLDFGIAKLMDARTSAFAFKGKREDVRRIAGALGVSKVLEGSVRRAGNRIRVMAQLIEAADGTHIWSERRLSSGVCVDRRRRSGQC